MSTSTSAQAATTVIEPETTQLRLASGNGTITRTVLITPLRPATTTEIPVIDISGCFSSTFADRQDVANRIRDASMRNGFFYITNHGVPESVTNDARAACLDFFRQDLSSKMQADYHKSTWVNGYKAPRTQRLNPDEGIDVRESFSWTYDPRFDPTVDDVEAIPSHAKKYMRLEDFPWKATEQMPHFKEAIVTYFGHCLRLARALTRSFALSLGLPENVFDQKVAYPDAAYAFNYYPPISGVKTLESSGSLPVSIGSHTDFQLFTILWQDLVGGLEVLDRSGQWLIAEPIKGTMVVNIADYLQRMTNDLYVSTVHRARNRSGEERISMPFFWGFGLHESCGVLDSCVKEGEKPRYEEVGCEDWVQRRVKAMMDVGKVPADTGDVSQ